MVSAAGAQTPRVGDINFYGLRKVTAERILSALELKSGDPLPASKADLEERIEKVPGVAMARVEAVCCEGSDATLFIGIEEKGAPLPALRTAPAGSVTLPQELTDAYREFLSAVAGEADAELHQFWEKGERETVIRQALGQSGGSRRKHGG